MTTSLVRTPSGKPPLLPSGLGEFGQFPVPP